MKNVYCTRDRLMGTYSVPIFAPDMPQDFVRGNVSFILHNPKKAYEQHLDAMEIVHLGTYDETTAKFSLLDSPVVLQDLGPVCESVKPKEE